MRAKYKAISILAGIVIASTTVNTHYFNPIPVAEAHSGRTDSNGGHRDNKNKSGLGSYHYHCGGYPAHLHPDGVCPYRNGSQETSTAQTSTVVSTPVIPDNISLVFDYKQYADYNPDLLALYGYDYDKLVNHFISAGMEEGRVASSTFNVYAYKDNNSDLQALFGNDLKSYYEHYMTSGYLENRIAY